MQLRPSRDDFHALARDHTVVPVWAEVLGDLETPVAAYAKLVGDAPGFLLESVEHGERWSRFSFVGRDPVATLSLRDGVVTVDGPLPVAVPTDQGMLAALETLLHTYRAPVIPDLPPLHGGLMGYLGYDVVREVERLPAVPEDDRHFPDAVMSMIGSLAAFDHWRQRVTMIESVPVLDVAGTALDDAYDAAVASIERGVANLARPLPYVPVEPPSADDVLPETKNSMPDGLYQQAVAAAKDHIVAGDIFQVVLAQRYDLQLDADPFDVYRVLRQINPSPYMYFVRHPEVTIVGSSPEPMVKLLDGKVISRPIAGTRKRGRTEEHDRRMAAELSEHPKERAEHVMLVDLARNDVGRVARFGTVHVDELMTLERYSHVMHLTSQVSGDLVDGLGPIDVLRATLPAGTVSGAPKVRAMEIIDDLEPVKRGPYAGVVGYLDWSGNLDTAIAIRTMFVGPGGASLQAGAGIVADSDPDDEDLECRRPRRPAHDGGPPRRRHRRVAPTIWARSVSRADLGAVGLRSATVRSQMAPKVSGLHAKRAAVVWKAALGSKCPVWS
jgi:anthranilate synthase component I